VDLLEQVRQAADRISPLSFGIIGKSVYGGEPWAVGSGVFIAPYLGLTAKHVVEGTWNQVEPEWKRNKWPKGQELTTHSLLLSQKLFLGRASEATWVIQEVSPVPGTDLMLLRISPQNDVAHQYRWGCGFLDLQLLPPPAGARVWVFGYPESRAENDAERANIISGDFQVELHSATVTSIEDYRYDSLKNFPGFEFAPGVKGGGSGEALKFTGFVALPRRPHAPRRAPSNRLGFSDHLLRRENCLDFAGLRHSPFAPQRVPRCPTRR